MTAAEAARLHFGEEKRECLITRRPLPPAGPGGVWAVPFPLPLLLRWLGVMKKRRKNMFLKLLLKGSTFWGGRIH